MKHPAGEQSERQRAYREAYAMKVEFVVRTISRVLRGGPGDSSLRSAHFRGRLASTRQPGAHLVSAGRAAETATLILNRRGARRPAAWGQVRPRVNGMMSSPA